MIEVMVADDNTHFNKMCCEFLTKDKDIKIVSSTTDGEETLKEYCIKKPDVLLLDLDLPTMSGIDIIENLCLDTEEKNKCNIVIISGDINKRSSLFNTSKVYRIIPKPVNFDLVLETIKEISSYTKQADISQKELKELLLSLNFNIYSTGTMYLIDAINTAYQNPNLLINIKELYMNIGTKNTLPPSRIKWGIRNSIEAMTKNTRDENIKSVLPMYNGTRNLTPKYFIALILNYFA